MLNFNVPVAGFALILFCQLYDNVGTRSLKFTGGTSIFSPKYFTNLTIYSIDDCLYLGADLIRPLVSGLKAKLEFQIRLANSKNYQTLFGYNFDVCKMAVTYKDTLYKRMYKSILKHGNFMPNCPVNVGHYYLNGWHMESSLVPPYFFAGDYRIKCYFYTAKTKNINDEFIANVSINAAVVDN